MSPRTQRNKFWVLEGAILQEVIFPGSQLGINFTLLTHKLALICNHVFDEFKLRELLKDIRKNSEFTRHLGGNA